MNRIADAVAKLEKIYEETEIVYRKTKDVHTQGILVGLSQAIGEIQCAMELAIADAN